MAGPLGHQWVSSVADKEEEKEDAYDEVQWGEHRGHLSRFQYGNSCLLAEALNVC